MSKSDQKVEEKNRPTKKSLRRNLSPKKKKGKPILENLVTLKEIAFDYELEPRLIRKLLRKNSIKRPLGRWEWDRESKEFKQLQALLEKHSKRKKE